MKTTPEARKNKRPSEEDLRLWRLVTRDIMPLKSKASRQAVRPEVLLKEVPSSPGRSLRDSTAIGAAEAEQPRRDVPLSPRAKLAAGAPPPPPPQVRPSLLDHGDLRAMDKRKAQRLRRGRLPVEARLDLHGLNQEDAHRELRRFVRQSVVLGRRCVLVITGKGGRQGSGGVLRRQVPLWLNEADLRDQLLGFDHARPEHGGTGALYLVLRRLRGERER